MGLTELAAKIQTSGISGFFAKQGHGVASRSEATRLKVMFCGLCLGQDMGGLPFRFGYC
jgi:hypothetical protein